MTTTRAIGGIQGHVVAWEVGSKEISFADLRRALDDAGINLEVGELAARAAFTRAAGKLSKERLIKCVRSQCDDEFLAYQANGIRNEDTRIEYDYEAIIKVHRGTGRVECDECPQLAKRVQGLLDHAMGHRNTSDITRIVQKAFAQNADLFPLIPAKGVAYFVPVAHSEFLGKVAVFLEAVNGKLHQFPVPEGTPEGDKAVEGAITARMDSLIAELLDCTKEWSDTTRDSTLEKSLERWEQVAFKVDAHQVYLGSQIDRLKGELGRAKDFLAKRIEEIYTLKADVDADAADAADAADHGTKVSTKQFAFATE